MIKLAIYAALAAMFAFGIHRVWSDFTGRYIAMGAASQLAADRVDFGKVKARADEAEQNAAHEKSRAEQSERDTQECVTASANQSAGIAQVKRDSDEAVKRTRAEAVAAKSEAVATRARMAQLAAYAAARPVVQQSCETTNTKADEILRTEARARRAPPSADALGLTPKK